jgi:FKBP-type peptidyl-prolyl cis-trans isomerase
VRTAAIVLVAGLAASLAACSSASPVVADCLPTSPGSSSDAVTISGNFGEEPTVEFDFPLNVEETQRTVVIAGDPGDDESVARTNDDIMIQFALYNGATGEKLTSSYESGAEEEFIVDEDIYLPGLIKTLQCSPVGERVVGVIPPGDALGENGSAELGVEGGDSIVFIADIVSIAPGVATGAKQPAVEGMPIVTLAEDGTPTIEIPSSDPPTDLQIAVLKKGDGDVVLDGDSVKVQYLGINWNTNTVFDKSWDQALPPSFSTDGVVPGFAQALIGQSVGSQVLVVIPPELAYGSEGGAGGAIGGTDTIVFVIDILDVTPAE